MIWALKKVSQVTSEGETLILRKNAPRIHFDKKIANTGSKIFLLTTKLYKNPNDAAILDTEENNLEGNKAMEIEERAFKEQTKNKILAKQKIHVNKIH